MQVVDRHNLPPDSWLVAGDLTSTAENTDGTLTLRLDLGDRLEWVQTQGSTRFSVGSREVKQDDLLTYLKTVARPLVWLGVNPSGVWGVTVWPCDLAATLAHKID